MSEGKKKVVIFGAGLVGAYTAVALLEHHRSSISEVIIYEKREDMRLTSAEAGRSINLIVTSRGLYALGAVGLTQKALALCVPVRGRAMHAADGSSAFQPYGVSPSEVNYSVSRSALNCMLMDEAERRGAIIRFGAETEGVDFPVMTASVASFAKPPGGGPAVKTVSEVRADVFIGTDGAGSPVRQSMVQRLRADGVCATDSIERLGVSYKEVSFPAGTDGKYSMDGSALHIWPRGPHFLMALADLRNTFTGTLYLPDDSAPLPIPDGVAASGVPTFAALDNDPANVASYIQRFMPDVPGLVPDVAKQLTSRAHGFLATLRLSHWHFKGSGVVLGDAAHAIVPFFGQGMNLGFETALLLDRLLLRHGWSNAGREAAFAELEASHRPSATAIANMAIENFGEMSYKVGLKEFLHRKQIENAIESQFPSLLRSRYHLVTKTLVPYKTVLEAGELIDRSVEGVAALLRERHQPGQQTVADEVRELPTGAVQRVVDANLTPFLRRHKIDLTKPLDDSFYPSPAPPSRL